MLPAKRGHVVAFLLFSYKRLYTVAIGIQTKRVYKDLRCLQTACVHVLCISKYRMSTNTEKSLCQQRNCLSKLSGLTLETENETHRCPGHPPTYSLPSDRSLPPGGRNADQRQRPFRWTIHKRCVLRLCHFCSFWFVGGKLLTFC